MNLIEIETSKAIIDRLKSFLPTAMAGSVLPYLDKPEELTEDVLADSHPKGLYLVQFIESEADGEEQMIFGVYTVAAKIDVGGVVTSALEQTYKLTRAAKLIVNGLKPFGGHALTLHKDEHCQEEAGVLMRVVSFRLINQTLPMSESRITAKIEEMNL